MSFSRSTKQSTGGCSAELARLRRELSAADAVVVGAGAGLSAAAGFTYSGERFTGRFADFIERYGFTDMYSAGFYPYKTWEEFWAYWSRYIMANRYDQPAGEPYLNLLRLLDGKDYFVLTTNVDHRFQIAGFDKERLFYTQGDYGLWQCPTPCHQKTYENEAAVRRMAAVQRDLRIPSELVPHCPRCGKPMVMNLRVDCGFVEDAGWHAAEERYSAFVKRCMDKRALYLELGVGNNTPSIIKYPFLELTRLNPKAIYACVNAGEAYAPPEIGERSICLNADLSPVLEALLETGPAGVPPISSEARR